MDTNVEKGEQKIGELLAMLRANRGIDIGEIASALYITEARYRGYENNSGQMKVEDLASVLKFYGVDIADFLSAVVRIEPRPPVLTTEEWDALVAVRNSFDWD